MPRVCSALVDSRDQGWLLQENALESIPELAEFLEGAKSFISGVPPKPLKDGVTQWGPFFLNLCKGISPRDWIAHIQGY